MTTFPGDISNNRQRFPHTLYRAGNVGTPDAVVIGTANEFVNITNLVAVALASDEVGFTHVIPDPGTGPEPANAYIRSEFSGPVAASLMARVSGGVATNTTTLALYVEPDLVTPWDFDTAPLPVANVQDRYKDISTQDTVELMGVIWHISHAAGEQAAVGIKGRRFQILLASSIATTISVHSIALNLARETGANVGA